MMKNMRSPVVVSLTLLIVVLSFSITVGAQQGSAKRYKPANEMDLQLKEEAGLTTQQVLKLLHDEPALMLEVKRLLAQKAYEQGRLLETDDLTENAVFTLIREDAAIRGMVTEEIINRNYLKLHPTDEELTKDIVAEHQFQRALDDFDQRREDKSGDDRSESSPRSITSKRTSREPLPSNPLGSDDQGTESPISAFPKTGINRAGLDPRTKDSRLTAKGAEGGNVMPRVSPEDLPALLAGASLSGGGGLSDLSSVAGANSKQRELPSEREILDGSMDARNSDEDARYGRSTIRNRTKSREESGVNRQPNPYADVPALYDLYSQIKGATRTPERFGASVFRNGTGNFNELPMDVPVGPDYVLGPGDGLNIELWGGSSQRFQRVVGRDGRVALPEIGLVQVAGRTLSNVQQLLQSEMRTQFRDLRVDLSIARLRTVRVYVVGDVEQPGAYDISALSTPLNALYAAGGATNRGSLRVLRQYRGKQLVQEVDIYDLILRGIRGDIQRLQSGDTIFVPPVGREVTLEGMVRRPAIYEIADEKNLSDVLALAGGVLPSGTLRNIRVQRVEAHEKRIVLSLDLPSGTAKDEVARALRDFNIQEGDRIFVQPIVPYSEKTVYLDGHAFSPGKYEFRDGMRVSDLIKSYSALLPEPSKQHAEIIRLNPPDFRPAIIAFNLGDALSGKQDSNLVLQPFDTVRIFGRYDFEDAPMVRVSGEVRAPGLHRTNGELHLRDAIYLAGGVTPEALLDDAQIFRTSDGATHVLNVNLRKALSGEDSENLLLQAQDRVVIHRNMAKVDPPAVFIRGEVAKPGKYPLSNGMTASQLVRVAGGLKRSAFTDRASLSRFTVQDGQQVTGEYAELEIGKAMSMAEADAPLHDGDTLTIRQLTGWKDIGSSVSVLGEVMHPSTFGIHEGERLSSVLRRAGGFRPDAYPQGAVLERAAVRELEEKNREELVKRLNEEQMAYKIAPGARPADEIALRQGFLRQQQAILSNLESAPATGRLVVKIASDMSRWENTSADIEVRAGDIIRVPKVPSYVVVTGQVYKPSAVTFRPGKNARWYLQQAGGSTDLGNAKRIFVVRADGSVVGQGGGTGGWWKEDPLSRTLHPGDMVVVPEKLLTGNSTWRSILETSQVLSSVAIAASVAVR